MKNFPHPLVSFCLKCFNQHELIVPALRGAFAQTYRPLEIVIADDCSTDGSVAVIQEMIDRYYASGGDVPVKFIKNERNLGNLGNWDCLCRAASGELLIKADGDDISLPERAAEIVKAWESDGRKALVVNTAYIRIDQEGAVLDDCPVLKENFGATSAYSRRLVDSFAPIISTEKNRFAADDVVYGARARILNGQHLLIDKPLVQYRIGSGVSSGTTGYRRFMTYGLRSIVLSTDQMLADLASCREAVKQEERERLSDGFKSTRARMEVLLTLWEDKSFRKRWSAFRNVWPTVGARLQSRVIVVLLLCGFPNVCFDLILKAKYLLRRVRSILKPVRA